MQAKVEYLLTLTRSRTCDVSPERQFEMKSAQSEINYFFVPEPVRRSFSEGGCLRRQNSVHSAAKKI